MKEYKFDATCNAYSSLLITAQQFPSLIGN